MTQSPDDHLKALWQGQEKETPTMTAIAVRALARNYVENMRGRIWLAFTFGVFEVLLFGLQAWRAPNGFMRAGDVIMMAGGVWMIWRIIAKRPGRLPPPEASIATLIDFHRAELERQPTNASWMAVTAAPIFAGMLVVVVGMQKARPNMSLANVAPFLSLIIVWWIWAFVLQKRQAKRRAEQIAEMDQLRRG
ncbi:hypothetical protein [Phenylobacterium sp.]|uniref:hypothetical protein n=1 Tax=Phenylobacterium sp. TaxID=1871053 RepID=UPI002B955EDC|nr:hypothetical protein [Phenylobacterium sp.]HLZ76703.1 hypothetical protein [Phenylobacterium sp.]